MPPAVSDERSSLISYSLSFITSRINPLLLPSVRDAITISPSKRMKTLTERWNKIFKKTDEKKWLTNRFVPMHRDEFGTLDKIFWRKNNDNPKTD